MKKINFIAPLSVKQQYEIRYWFILSCTIFILLISISLFFLIPPIIQYKTLKKEVSHLQHKTKKYNTLVSKKQNLEKQLEQLNTKDKKINTYTQQLKNPHSYIKIIFESLSKEMQLQSLQINKNEFTLMIKTKNTHDIQIFLEKLLTSGTFSDVLLHSFERNESKELSCIIKAYSKKP